MSAAAPRQGAGPAADVAAPRQAGRPGSDLARSGSLRTQLLRWMLIRLTLLLLSDAICSYSFARHLCDQVYDGELL
jgi:hypothetical protein